MDIVDDHRMVMTAISAKRDQMRMIVGKIGMLTVSYTHLRAHET